MKTRVITGALMGLFFIPVFIFGDMLLITTLLILSLIATVEMLHMIASKTPIPKSLYGYGIVMNLVFYSIFTASLLDIITIDVMWPLMLGFVLSGSLVMVLVEEMSFDIFSKIILATLYPVLGFVAMLYIRDEGLAFLGLLFVVTVSTDVFAYFVGVTIGKHKLAPKISPKKSVEGSIGGIVFAVILSIVFVLVVNVNDTVINIPIYLVGLIALFASIMSQIGDLVASKMKRNYEIKDFSQLFPGHGGVMDRFDSSLFAAMLFVFVMMMGLI